MKTTNDGGAFERGNAEDGNRAGIGHNSGLTEAMEAHGRYTIECRDANGNLKWTDAIENVVTIVGKNDLLDKYLAGSSYTAAFYLGLISNTSYTSGPASGDTAASHSGWTEDVTYSNSTRVAPSWNAAAAGSKASNAATFNINGTATIKGAFLITDSTKSGTSGTLFSAGLFTGGDKSVSSGDSLNVTWTGSV